MDFLGLALATMADAMAARAGRRGQSVSGLRQQIAGREGRDRERSEREVLRQYRNKARQFEFEQEGVRRRLAKESKMEEREYRRGEKESEFQRMMKLAGMGEDTAAEGTVGRMRMEESKGRNRLELDENLRSIPAGDLSALGSQERDAILAKAEDLGLSREEIEAKIKWAMFRKRAAQRSQSEYDKSGRWRLWAGEPWEKVRGGR